MDLVARPSVVFDNCVKQGVHDRLQSFQVMVGVDLDIGVVEEGRAEYLGQRLVLVVHHQFLVHHQVCLSVVDDSPGFEGDE